MDFLLGLTQTHHDSGLDPPPIGLGHPTLRGFGEKLQGALVSTTRSSGPVEPGDRLHVVGEDLRPGRQNDIECFGHTAEVGCQDLDGRGTLETMNGLDHSSKMPGSPVGQIIPVHRCDDGMGEPHDLYGLGHSLGLGLIDSRSRPTGGHRTESATPGTDVPQNHEGRGAMLAPALVDVGAARLFTDGIEL